MSEFKKIEPDLSFVKGVLEGGGDTVKRCYQCATCSVVCPLSTVESPFPRKEMVWAQWGLASKIAGDRDVWLCHQCGDCSVYCPRDAKPADVLGGIRANAIRYYAQPKALADMLSTPGGVIGAVASAMILILMVAWVWAEVTGHAFPFPEGRVEYHKFLSVIPIDLIFVPLAGLAAFVSAIGVMNFWRDLNEGSGVPTSYTGTNPKPSFGALLKDYVWPAFKEILSHERFKKCGATAERVKGHLWVLWAFIILFVVTNIVMIYADVLGNLFPDAGFHTPLPLWHPVKILANIGAVMLIAGIWMIKTMRSEKTAEGVLKSSTRDWILIWLIFAVAASGIGAELIRLLNISVLAYPVYLLHLGCVAILFLSLPYTKFAHLLYRTTAYVHQSWSDDVKAGKAGFGGEKRVMAPGEEH